MKRIPLFLLISLIVFSCTSKQEASYSMMAEEAVYDDLSVEAMERTTESSALEVTDQPDIAKKKIIKNGRLGMQVTDLKKSKQRVDSLLIRYKGYYAKESQYDSNYESVFNLKIRIPVTHYEQFIADVESGNGNTLFKEIDANDVTEQYVDIETRLTNKRSYLQRYRELLKQAKNIKEILEVEEHIRNLEEEIESAEGRLRHLSDQVAYSTLDLTLSKTLEYTPGRSINFFNRFIDSLLSGWYGLVDIILVVITLWPLWIAVGGLFFLWKRIRSKRKKK